MSDSVISRSATGLIIFIRNPELGKVKTRLAEDLGQEKALAIYVSLLNYTKDICLQVDTTRYLYYFDRIGDDEWSTVHFHKMIQEGKNLGENMSLAFREVLQQHRKAIIIGSDCPQLTPQLIHNAYAYLNQYDIVIGPTFDGGYYLLGMTKHHQKLFENIEWSTPHVLEETLKIARQYSLTYHLLEMLSDIDYKSDWEEFGWEV